MKFLKFTIVTLLMSFAFAACEKDQVGIPVTPPVEKPVPEIKPVQATWMGSRYGLNKSIPVYFGFQVKAEGKLDVLNTAKKLIGTGSWNFNNDVFTATYSISSSGQTYSVRSNFFEKPDKIGGTWGLDTNDENGGTWEMTKAN